MLGRQLREFQDGYSHTPPGGSKPALPINTSISGASMTGAFIICAAMTSISAATSFGFSVATIQNANSDARTIAFYAAARSLALFAASVLPLLTGSLDWLLALAWIMIAVQVLDAIIGMSISDKMKTFGPAAAAALNLAAVIWLVLSI